MIKENPSFLENYSIMLTALWSLTSNIEKDPALGEIVDQILHGNPEMNFIEKPNKILNERKPDISQI